MDRAFRPETVARKLDVEPSVVFELIRDGVLGAFEIRPGVVRIPASDLRRFVSIRCRDFDETTAATLARER